MASSHEPLHEAVQDGVLSAIMHVAAVSALDAHELALEFDAGRDVIARRLHARSDCGVLASALRDGLPIERLKAVAQRCWGRDGELALLAHSLEVIEPEHRETYRSLILETAEAAARTRMPSAFLPHGAVTLQERAALAEISALFER